MNAMISRQTFRTAFAAMALIGVIGFYGCNGGGEAGSGSGAGGSADEIRIGLVASQTGELVPWGMDSIRGAELAVEEANAAGGINGKQIRLIIGDSASRPETGKSAAEKLISADNVIALLGEVASSITIPVAQVANERNIPLIAIGATKTDITDIGDHIFRVCYTDDLQGAVMAHFAYHDLNLRRVAIMTDNKQAYSKDLSISFRRTFEEIGGTIVDEQFYESGQTQFAGQLTNLQQTRPEGIFMSGYFNEVGPIARQARDTGITARFFGGDGWDSSELLSSGGEAIVGGYFCNHYNETDGRQEVQDFLALWENKYGGRPGTTMGVLGYDAAKLMIDAMRRAEELTPAAIGNAIENTVNFPGASGEITLQGMNGNPVKPALVVRVTRDGFQFAKRFSHEEIMGE